MSRGRDRQYRAGISRDVRNYRANRKLKFEQSWHARTRYSNLALSIDLSESRAGISIDLRSQTNRKSNLEQG